MIGLFDHVLVRATIGGRTYWLDGTRTGDGSLDRLTIPNYGWGLPLTQTGAALVRMVPPPLDAPSQTMSIRLDASGGITAPAPAHAELVLEHDDAVAMNITVASLDADARDRALRGFWHSQLDFVDITSVSAAFDPRIGEERLVMDGVAHMDWSSGYYETDQMTVGFKPDFLRDPRSDQDAPYATAYPYFTRAIETILLPPGFGATAASARSDLDQTVAGMEYHRHASLQGNNFVIEKTERSLVPEWPAKDAAAASTILHQIADKTVILYKPSGYRPTAQEGQASTSATPTTAPGFIERAGALLNQNRLDDAIADFSQAIALDPKNVLALSGRGMAYVLKGDQASASRDVDAASAIDPKNLIVLKARALIAYSKGDYAGAIAAYGAVLAIDPKDSFSIGNRAKAEAAVRDFDAALRDAAAALKGNPQWVEMHLVRLNILKSQGKTEETLAEADALAAYPGDSYAQVSAANTYAALGKTTLAMQAYDRALAIKPEAYVYLNRAETRPKSDLAGKRTDLDAALALDPKYAPALAAKARLLQEQGDSATAIASLSKALEAAPADLELLLERGMAYAKTGDRARAEVDFTAARAHAPQAGQLNYMCWEKATAGVALESALADCDAALAKSPGVPAFLDSRAFVMLRLGRLDEAIAEYTRAIHKAPRQAASLYGRGVAWSRKGDKAQAAADQAVAMKIDANVRTQFEGYGVRP